jgi:hypothetical protein
LTLKSDNEKSGNSADLVQENSFSPTYFLSLFRLVKKGAKDVHMLKKSVINMNRPVLPDLDWPFTMIGPGGLLSVVPTCLQSPFQFYRWDYKNVNN